jgi:hypothetical protein
MARFRKTELRMWADARFRALTPPAPNARDLWIALIIGECTTQIPGIVVATPSRLYDSLGWGAPELREACERALAEVLLKMPVQADTRAGLLWLPNGPKYNRPQNPNVIKGWRETWALIPECDLKRVALAGLVGYAKAWGHAYSAALGMITDSTPGNTRDQEQEQEAGAGREDHEGQGALFPPRAAGTTASKLAFRAAEALQLVADASSGRFQATNPGGQAVEIERVIREHADRAEWVLLGEYLGAGGEGYIEGVIDSRWLTRRNFEAALARARDWSGRNRPSLAHDRQGPPQRGRVAPVRRFGE